MGRDEKVWKRGEEKAAGDKENTGGKEQPVIYDHASVHLKLRVNAPDIEHLCRGKICFALKCLPGECCLEISKSEKKKKEGSESRSKTTTKKMA